MSSIYIKIPPDGGSGGAVDSVNGKTGAVTITKTDVGLGNVDNTSDANKPISSATQSALNTKQDNIQSGAYNSKKAIVSNLNGKILESATSQDELERLVGVTSNVQDQINDKVGGDPDLNAFVFDDFSKTSLSTGSFNWSQALTGTGAGTNTSFDSTYVNNTTNALGIIKQTTGTTAGGRHAFHNGAQSFLAGFFEFDARMRAALAQLGSAGQQFEYTIGLISAMGSIEFHNVGVYFRFKGDGTNVNWQCVTSNAATHTTTTTAVPVVVNQFYKFEIIVNQNATQAQFFIDGVLVATHTTNLPAPLAPFGFGSKIYKTVGTTEAISIVDYMYLKNTRLTAR